MTIPPGTKPEDVAWLERHENVKILVKITKPVLVPVLVALLGVYFDHRIGNVDDKVHQNTQRQDVGWKTMVPAVQELQQGQVLINQRLDLMQQLLLAFARNGGGAPVSSGPGTPAAGGASMSGTPRIGGAGTRPQPRPAPPPPTPVLTEKTKVHLLKEIESTKAQSQSPQQRLPNTIEELPVQKK